MFFTSCGVHAFGRVPKNMIAIRRFRSETCLTPSGVATVLKTEVTLIPRKIENDWFSSKGRDKPEVGNRRFRRLNAAEVDEHQAASAVN